MGGHRSIERELKVEVPAEFTMPAFDGFEPLAPRASSVGLHAVYWDTEDLALAAWGHTLRSRRADDGSEHNWTLKIATGSGTGAVSVRHEVDYAGGTDTPPSAALDVVRGIIGHRPVGPVAAIDSTRHRLQLRHRALGSTVEVDDDVVTSTVAGAPGRSFREIEIELVDGDPAALHHAGALLDSAGAGSPDPTPKLFRVLSGRMPVAPLGLNGERPRTAGALVSAAIAGGTRQLLANDPVVRLNGDVEAVHQARVATRRLRSNLKTLGALLDPFRVEGLRRELAWLGAMLGHVRDRDVLETTLTRHARSIASHDDDGVDRVLQHLRGERDVQLGVLLDVMRSSRYHGLIADLTRLSASPPLRAQPQVTEPAKAVARELAGAAYKRLERKVDHLPHRPAAAELHEVRKAAKQARYAAELVAPLAKGKTDRLSRSLAKLQDHLGDKQDDATLAGWLAQLPFDALGGAAAFAAGRLAQESARATETARTDWHRSWAAVRAAHDRSWLG